MKNLSKLALLTFAVASFTFASCDSKPAENTENAVEEAVGNDESTAEGDTAVVQDQPVQDGVVDSIGTN
jgi:hypothetical protein